MGPVMILLSLCRELVVGAFSLWGQLQQLLQCEQGRQREQ